MRDIDVENVTKTYGNVTALDGLSVSVEAGTTFGLLGTNGAGKTTLLKLLVGLLEPDDGRLEVAGLDVASAGARVRERVGYLPERVGFPRSMTGHEVLSFHARMRGVSSVRERVSSVLDTVRLVDAADRVVSGYSNGMTRRLGLATALVGSPRILLLDEPTAGLDPLGISRFHDIVEEVSSDVTVVFSSHALDEVERLTDEVAIVHDGVVKAIGSPSDLRGSVNDDVTVTIRFTDETDAQIARDELSAYPVLVQRDREPLVFTCSHGTALDALAAVQSVVSVAGFEVTEPTLDRAFQHAIAYGGAP